MFEKRFPKDGKKKRRSRAVRRKAKPKVASHPLFGSIPLIHHHVSGGDGKPYEWWDYDPNYQPPMPRGAVRGDVQKQIYCRAHHTPKYFYIDEQHQCIQCGTTFVFQAKEQKYWYESLKFNFSSIPVRCIHCRRERRSEHALREQIARAKAEMGPNNPAAYVALARAIVEYYEKTQQGNLNEAIAAARKAKALWPDSVEPSLWEGISHALAGRSEKARVALKGFLSETGSAPAALKTKAEKYLQF